MGGLNSFLPSTFVGMAVYVASYFPCLKGHLITSIGL